MQESPSAATALCERAFSGSLLCGDARAMDSGLRASEFTDPLCRRIFAVALALEERGQSCDLATLADAAPDVDLSAAVELAQEAAPVAALAGQHADSIRTAAQRRALIAEGMALPSTNTRGGVIHTVASYEQQGAQGEVRHGL